MPTTGGTVIVFDLDETIGDFYSAQAYTLALKADKAQKDQKQAGVDPSPGLKAKLDAAYKLYIESIAEAEKLGSLGIFRTGIVQIFDILSQLQQVGKIRKIAIYSNNGHLFNLELARDVLQIITQNNGLFCELIHWGHPGRAAEITGGPGQANKTWEILSKILAEGQCSIKIEPHSTIFVDDMHHPDLQSVLGPNQVNIRPQKYRVPVNKIEFIYLNTINATGLASDPEYFQWLTANAVTSAGTNNVTKLLAALRSMTGRTNAGNSRAPNVDDQFMNRLSTTISVVMNQNNSTIGGGKNSRQTRQSRIAKRRSITQSRIRRLRRTMKKVQK